MSIQKSIIDQKLSVRLINRIFSSLVIVFSLVTPNSKSYGLVPDYAEVTYLLGEGISINEEPATLGSRLSQYKDFLAVPASAQNQSSFADLNLVKSGSGNLWLRAKAWNQRTTYYYIPCTLVQPQYSQAEMTWSNGISTACGEGMQVTTNPAGSAKMPNDQLLLSSQTSYLVENQLFSQASDNRSSWRYYCSSVADSGNGAGHIAAGLTSIAAACQQSQQTCETENGSGCSIATMGEWNINHADLMMSVTCADGNSESRRVSGTEVEALGSSPAALVQRLLEDLLGELGHTIAELLGIQPEACYLQVYAPDDILISPVSTEETTVQTTGLVSDQIQVEVIKGRVKLRSTEEPEGIIANPGDSYTFNGEGSISQEPVSQPTQPPDLAAQSINFDLIEQTSEFAGRVQITGTVENVGQGIFRSTPEQQEVQLYEVIPGASPNLVASQPIPNLSPGETTEVTYLRDWNSSSPSEGEFPPSYRLVIVYDPDIQQDNNPQNDDPNSRNNQQQRSGADINALFRNTPSSIPNRFEVR